jgi:hypothetical protein
VFKHLPNIILPTFRQFCPWPTWLINANLSANAQSRRQPGESDDSLAYRVVKEYMTGYSDAIRNASGGGGGNGDGGTTVGFFGAEAKQNIGVGAFPWSILKELGQVSQPAYYGQWNIPFCSGFSLVFFTRELCQIAPSGLTPHKQVSKADHFEAILTQNFSGQHNVRNLPLMVASLRAEKAALGSGSGASRMLPWLTVGTSGPVVMLFHYFLLDFPDVCSLVNSAGSLCRPFHWASLRSGAAPSVVGAGKVS